MGLTDHLERDDAAALRAEDEAIRAAETPNEPKVSALDALAEILSDRDTPEVHPEAEAGGGPGR